MPVAPPPEPIPSPGARAMPGALPACYEEWRRAFLLRRLHLAIWVGILGYPSFLPVDWLAYPAQFRSLLLIRLLTEVALFGMLLALRTAAVRRRPEGLLFVLGASLSIAIAQMTVHLGGFHSPYYAGMNLIFLGMALLVPVRWGVHVAAQGATLLYYFAANALVSSPPPWRAAVFDAGVFLLWCCMLCDLSAFLYERLQRSEYEGRKALEAANVHLREMDRLKNEFYANVSHELRTPLTLIVGAFRSLVSSAAEGVRGIAETGLRNASRLLLLINELLDLAKLDGGRAAPARRTIDLAALVRHVAANFDSSGWGRRIQIEGAERPLLASLDPGQMKKVLYNLLSNAFKFSDPETGRVRLALTGGAERVRLEVEDNGIGIPREQFARIFDRFTQVEGAATRRFEGTGIGLALVREIVELHGGTVTVASEVGMGTTFTLVLPRGAVGGATPAETSEDDREMLDFLQRAQREAPAQAQAVRAPEGSASGDAPLVLVIEDNRDLRTYLVGLLGRRYGVAVAADGVQGIERARALRPDLVLTDVMMPRMSGDEVLRAIRQDAVLRETPVLFLTARAGMDVRIESLDAGADDYLAKPFHEGELLARVGNLLRASAQKRELGELNRRLTARVEEQVGELVRTGALKRFLPQPVVEGLLSGVLDAQRRLARRRVTVLFADLVGFTGLTERLEPEDLSSLLNEFLRETTAIAVDQGGTVDKFIGDAVMVLFGAPEERETEDQAWDAVRTAVAMRACMERLGARWRGKGIAGDHALRIGINTGYSTVGVFGCDLLQSYTAIGTPVNVAARVQAEAPPGGIYCSFATYAAIRNRVQATSRGTRTFAGVRHPVEVFEIHELTEGAPPRPGS